jgi:hypothetical protein
MAHDGITNAPMMADPDLEQLAALDYDYFRQREDVTAAMGMYLLFFSKKARTKRRRRHLLSLGLYSKKKRCKKIDLPTPSTSPWAIFLRNNLGDAESWFDWVGLDKPSFESLVGQCRTLWRESPLLEASGPPRPCDLKRRLLSCTDTVGLLLCHMTKRGDHSVFSKLFGIVETEVPKYLEFGLQIAIPVLKANEHARAYWPLDDPQYLAEMAELLRPYAEDFREEIGRDPIAWMDAVRYKIVNKGDPEEKKIDQTNEKKDTMRKCQFIFDPNNRCVSYALNLPPLGDSKCCELSGLYDKIEQLPDQYCIVADTAYNGALMNRPIIKILKLNQYLPLGLTPEEVRRKEKVIIHSRQPSEWANNQIVQSIVRPRCKLSHDDLHNTRLLELGVLLHNFRVHRDGGSMDRWKLQQDGNKKV